MSDYRLYCELENFGALPSDEQIRDAWVILGKLRHEVSESDIERGRVTIRSYHCVDVPELVRALNKIVLENGEDPDIVLDSNKLSEWDHFAAAALAGFGVGIPAEKTVKMCCDVADLMVQESQRRRRES